MSIFYLEIEMGNDAMCHRMDVSEALGRLSHSVAIHDSGNIRDINGNIVGSFGYRD